YAWRTKGPNAATTGGTPPPGASPGYLANSGSLTLTSATSLQVEMGTQRAGDCDSNNTVSLTDFNILKNTFGRTSTTTGYDNRAVGIKRSLALPNVVIDCGLGVFEDVPREDAGHALARLDGPCAGQLARPGQRRRRCRLAADACAVNDRFGLQYLVVAYFGN